MRKTTTTKQDSLTQGTSVHVCSIILANLLSSRPTDLLIHIKAALFTCVHTILNKNINDRCALIMMS